MINYFKILLRLSELPEPARELSKDKVPFNWDPDHQKAFTQMKKEISSALVLAYYNSKKQTMLPTKILVLFYFKMANLFILQAKP